MNYNSTDEIDEIINDKNMNLNNMRQIQKTVIKEQVNSLMDFNLDKESDKCDHQNEVTKQEDSEKETKIDEQNLRVKVVLEGSNQQQVNYIENPIKLTNKLTDKVTNDEMNNQNRVNESTDCNSGTNSWAVHQEQVIEKFENFVKPNKQGDQVSSLTQSANSNYNSQTVNDTLKESKFNESSAHANFSLKQTQQCASSELAKSIYFLKSESPSIHFEQRVSVVKNTFENKVKSMMNSECADKLNDKNCDKSSDKNQFNKMTDQKKKLEQINQLENAKLKKLNDFDSTESKIAREIRELKEREEELRLMRLKRENGNLVNCTINCSITNCPNNCQKKSYLSSSSSSTSSADSTISLNRSYKSDRSDSPPVSNGQCSASIDSLDEGFAEFKSPNSAKNQSAVLLSPPPTQNSPTSLLNNSNNLNKILATTRIQQEIEEQTRRELALKAAGSIKTISQERTDKLMMSNLLGSNLATPTKNILSPTSLSMSSLTSSLSSLNITNNNSSHSNSISQTSDQISPLPPTTSSTPPIVNQTKVNGYLKNNTTSVANNQTQIKIKTNIYTKNTNGLLKYRTFSTSNLNNLTSNNPTTMNLFKMNQTGRHISMAKFIATKGKSAIVDSSTNHQFNNPMQSNLSCSYNDLLRPPKIDRITAITAHKKCIQSADFKICSELKDLHEREQELR